MTTVKDEAPKQPHNDNNKEKEEEAHSVCHYFERAGFKEDDYAFYPVKNKVLKKIFRHLWIVPTFYLCIILVLNLGVYLYSTDSNNRQQINSMLGDYMDVRRIDNEQVVFLIYQSPFDKEPKHFVEPIEAFLRGLNIQDEEQFWETYNSYRQIENNLIDTIYYVAPFLIYAVVVCILIPKFMFRAPKLFWGLAYSGRLKPKSVESEFHIKWRTFAKHLNKKLVSPWRWALVAFLFGISIYLMLNVSSGRDTIDLFKIRGILESKQIPWIIIYEYIVILGIPIIFAPLLGLSGWLLLVVAHYINVLPLVFDIDIQPTHRDRCGGLKRIGDITLNMTVIVMVAGILLSIFYLTGIIQGSIPEIATFAYFGIAIIAIMSIFTFLKPIWRLHQTMVNERDLFRDKAIDAKTIIQDEASQILNSPQWSESQYEEMSHRLSVFDTLYPSDARFPTWPFNLKIGIAFVSGLLPQIAIIVIERIF